jgi:hypothetical protein
MEQLNWQITTKEKRKQVKKAILVAGPLIVGFAFFVLVASGRKINFVEIIYALSGIIILFFIFFLVNKFLPYPERTYLLADDKLVVSKGNKVKNYSWSEFECFYPYSERYGLKFYKDQRSAEIEEKRGEIILVGKNIEGEIFYLKKKPKNIFTKLYKVFVVIYSEIDNQKAVNRFLSNQLSKKPMKDTTDLGMVFYEFK